MDIDLYEVLYFLIGLGLVGLGVWLWFKDMFRVSFLLIGFGLMGLGVSFWSPAICLGVFILIFVVLWTRFEALGYPKRE